MNEFHETGAMDGRGEQDLGMMPLTRRAVAAGAIAGGLTMAYGAARQVFSGPASGDTTPTNAATGDVLGAAQPAASSATGTRVTIENLAFAPETLTVPIGTEVTWENRDAVPHTVTSDDTTTFASRLLDTGDRFSFTFTEPGTFSYFCSVHPMMTATVIVQA